MTTNTLNITDQIKENTKVYVKDGHWEQFYTKDSVTGDLIAITPISESRMLVHTVKPGTTYQDIHAYNDIVVYDNSPIVNIAKLTNTTKQPVITIIPEHRYSDGKHILITSEEQTFAVKDPRSFNQCPVTLINDVTLEPVTVMLSDLHSEGSEQFTHTLL